MSHITFNGPFIKGFTHADATVGTTAFELLAKAVAPARRVSVVIQNQSTTATLDVILADAGTAGIAVAPGTMLQLDNYNGTVRVVSTAASTPVHVAYATA